MPSKTTRNVNRRAVAAAERERRAYFADELALPDPADKLCPFRPCYQKTEAHGQDYLAAVAYAGDPHPGFAPVCGTHLETGCPSWRASAHDKVDLARAILWASATLQNYRTGNSIQATRHRERAASVLVLVATALTERQNPPTEITLNESFLDEHERHGPHGCGNCGNAGCRDANDNPGT